MTLKTSKALTDNRLICALDTLRIYSGYNTSPSTADDPPTGHLLVEFLGCRLEWNPFNSSFEKGSDDPWQSVAVDDGRARYFRFSSTANPTILIQGTVTENYGGDLVVNHVDWTTGMVQTIDHFSIKVSQ